MKNGKNICIVEEKEKKNKILKNVAKENGAITLIVLITMIFIVSFLILTYISITNKAQTEAEITQKIKDKYGKVENAESIYNSYIGKNVIPIYTVEELLKIGTGEKIEIKGKTYTFSADKAYILMNDLSFKIEDYLDLLGEEGWEPIGKTNYAFDGNGYTILVELLDGSIAYCAKENEYTGVLEEIFISKVKTAEGGENNYRQTLLNSKVILSDSDKNSEQTYEITLCNNTEKSQYFEEIRRESYDNTNIVFELDNRLTPGYELKPKESVTFGITFKYSNEYKRTSAREVNK